MPVMKTPSPVTRPCVPDVICAGLAFVAAVMAVESLSTTPPSFSTLISRSEKASTYVCSTLYWKGISLVTPSAFRRNDNPGLRYAPPCAWTMKFSSVLQPVPYLARSTRALRAGSSSPPVKDPWKSLATYQPPNLAFSQGSTSSEESLASLKSATLASGMLAKKA